MKLDWSKVEAEQKERQKRLVLEGRKRHLRVRCLDRVGLTRFETKGYSNGEKAYTRHILSRRGDLITCDCIYRQRQPNSMCQHEAVVRAYIKRNRRKQNESSSS
jgi:hypothetical protein